MADYIVVDKTKLDAALAATANKIREATGKSGVIPFDYSDGTGFSDSMPADSDGTLEPKLLSGAVINSYVSRYIHDARASYANDLDRANTVITRYNAPVSGVRKDEPLPLSTTLNEGTFKLRENGIGNTYTETISQGNKDIYNISHNGGDFIVENNGIVDCGVINPNDKLRMIYAPSIYNVRDLGGWECDGGIIKYGLLYRGGDINDAQGFGNLSDSDKSMFLSLLGIKSEIDLSGNNSNRKSTFGDSVKYTSCWMSTHYVNAISYDGTEKAKLKSAIETVFDDVANGRPIYFHCLQGADRTGTLAFILEALLGVSEIDLDIDYELTSFSTVAGNRLRNDTSNFPYKSMVEYFKQCSTSSNIRDCVVAWCVLIGISIDDINAFRNNMIDGAPQSVSAQVDYSAKNIVLNASSDEIGIDESLVLSASITPSWSNSAITWSSSDASIVLVTPNGNSCSVKGISSGTAIITATANGCVSNYTVTVTQEQEQPQYTGNIVQQVGYSDNTRYSSTGATKAQSGYVATNKIPYHLQNDGKFKLHLSGINWAASQSYCLMCLFKDDAFKAQVSLFSDSDNDSYGWTITKNADGTVDVVLGSHDGHTWIESNQIGLSGQGIGENAIVEQIFPII